MNNFQQARCSDGKMSCNTIKENSNVQFFHSSAVKLKNDDEIFVGILLTLTAISYPLLNGI